MALLGNFANIIFCFLNNRLICSKSKHASYMFRTLKISDPRFESAGLRQLTVKSPSLKGRGDISLFIPSGIKSIANNVPVLILLHGVYGSHWSWSLTAGAHLTAAKLIEARLIRPMVLAMPSDGLWGDGSGYVAHAEQDFERWISEEVPAAVRAVVPETSEHSPLFIAGLSMGGFGALRIGAKYPNLFKGIAAHSAITQWEEMKHFVEEDFEEFPVFKEDRDIFELLLKNKAQLPPLRFDCGKDDLLIEGNRLLHQKLKDAHIKHTYEEFPGQHEWPYWEEHLVETLLFCDQVLSGELG